MRPFPRVPTRALLAVLHLSLLGVSAAAHAQPPGRVIGYLDLAAPRPYFLEALREGLRQHKWTENEATIDVRFAHGAHDRLRADAEDLARRRIDVIVAIGGAAGHAARRATTTVPILIVGVSDPVRAGLADSFARSGGNVAVVANLAMDSTPKQIELLKEVVPSISRIAVLGAPVSAGHAVPEAGLASSAKAARLTLHRAEVHSAADYPAVLAAIVKAGADSLLALPDPVNLSHATQICEFANRQRLPTIATHSIFATAGCLLTYGANTPGLLRHEAASYVDRILRGAAPGELPVQTPRTFELVVNERTAGVLGITLAPAIVMRATEIVR